MSTTPRTPSQLTGNELIDFAGAFWKVDSAFEAVGGWTVVAKFDGKELRFTVEPDATVDVIVAEGADQ